jgi:cell division control protein 6
MITESKIIVNPEALSQSYVPERLLHREKEKAQLLSNVKNFVNTLLVGSCGSGKTTLIKRVMRELDRKDNFAVYVDCAIYQTTYSVLKEIIPTSRLVFYRSNYELIRELRKFVKKGRFVVCLDNFDQLKDKEIIGKFMTLGICVILVTDSVEGFQSLRESVRSNTPSIIRLQEYTAEQVFDILKNRAEKALAKWSYSDEILKKIASKAGGNITLGINALKAAAIKVESEGKRTIEEADVQIENDCPQKLNRDEKVIMKVLEQWKSLPSSRLYDFYVQNTRNPKGKRSFRNYMESLCRKGLVRAIGEKRGRSYEIVEEESESRS